MFPPSDRNRRQPTSVKSESVSGNASKGHQHDDVAAMLTASIARKETRAIQVLRISVLLVLLATTVLVSTGIFLYTRNQEMEEFTNKFEADGTQVIESFHNLVERHLGASAWMSTSITSHALQSNQSFPFVTLEDFEMLGSHFRAISGSHVVHWMPIVSDDKRDAWEEYAMEHRNHIDEAFVQDMEHREAQDVRLGRSTRGLQQQEGALNMTILDEETGYHPKIWRAGGVVPPGDEPDGTGPYIPLWQRSPIDGARQRVLNMNFAQTKALRAGIIDSMVNQKKAVLNSVAVPIPEIKERLEANLRLSQSREHVDDYVDGLSTFLAYPVFDSFQNDVKKVAGILATNIYWKIFFTNILPSQSQGVICVVSNTFDQTFAYQIDGDNAYFLGMGDPHDHKYDDVGLSTQVSEYLQMRASPVNRAYATVPLSGDANYTLRVYPSQEMEDQYMTNEPIMYTVISVCCFAFASILFFVFSYLVERRQHIMIEKVLEGASKAATAERELNEFLAHEVRNPLSAAMSACSFVSTAVNEPEPLSTPETRKIVRDDIEVVNSSLRFINDFLRSMLDIHRATGNRIKIEKSPTDIQRDVFDAVSAILYKRMASFQVIVDCPDNLFVSTDPIRLKQVVLNLVRNSSKFVTSGFIKMRAGVVDDNQVQIYIEDSGPGIPLEKQQCLFSKYQESLDLLNQGTGLGLALSAKLMHSMGGDLWLDTNYNSGIEGNPGARFVLQLNEPRIAIESPPGTETESEPSNGVDSYRVETIESAIANGVPEKKATEEVDNRPPPSSAPTAMPTESSELPLELSVLFVDDDAMLRKLFVRAVKKVQPSWEVQEASSGEAAIRLLVDDESQERYPQQPDLIFMDQYMASVDKQLLGTETVQAMRSKGINSVICGLSANDIRDCFVRAGADDFVLKPMPCKADDLRELLSRILRSRQVTGYNC